jgi:hypothetical protein
MSPIIEFCITITMSNQDVSEAILRLTVKVIRKVGQRRSTTGIVPLWHAHDIQVKRML